MRPINIGLTETQRSGVIELLNRNLADVYLLLIKTRKYHWDVVGPQFRTLHELWQEHYEMLSAQTDDIAERVRALGGYPVGTAEGFLRHASLKEHPNDLPNATEMVQRLTLDYEQIIRNLRQHISQCADDYNDEGTADFLTGLMESYEETAWMLRSFIEGEALAGRSQSATKRDVPAGV
ncbi:MAG TPA: Dps family protein [Candidatus Obscuribacterales bacterium]